MELAKTIIYLLVGLVVFVTGMNMMSSGLKDSAGRFIRKLFKKIGRNVFASTGIGAGVTAIIQSSGATMVMVVGFLSAGALTFGQGFSLILGAFIGTTVTGLFVALSSFSFSIFLMALAFVGFVAGFFKNPTVKSISKILIGFGLLFFGLEAMKTSFAYVDIQNALVSFLSSISFPLLLMVIGALLTAVTQSSSATNGIVIVMVMSNPDFLASGFYLVLGATIGALMPAIISLNKSNNLSKRVILSTLICRVLGALIMTLIVWAVSKPLFDWLTSFPKEQTGLILAIFTVIYNLIYVLVMLPLIKPIDFLSSKIFKDKAKEKKKQALHFINDNLLGTPSVAIIQVKKEIESMYDLAKENFFLGLDMMLNQNVNSRSSELENKEETIDFINNEISEYLIKLSSKANIEDETSIGAYYHVINDIERIGDHGYNFYEMAKKMIDADISFSDVAKVEFNKYKDVLDEMFDVAKKTFMEGNQESLNRLIELEDITDKMKETFSNAHFKRIKNNECNNELSPYHSSLLSELERVADHLTNIGYSIKNPTGDEITHVING